MMMIQIEFIFIIHHYKYISDQLYCMALTFRFESYNYFDIKICKFI